LAIHSTALRISGALFLFLFLKVRPALGILSDHPRSCPRLLNISLNISLASSCSLKRSKGNTSKLPLLGHPRPVPEDATEITRVCHVIRPYMATLVEPLLHAFSRL
jgi:hypothetical protein